MRTLTRSWLRIVLTIVALPIAFPTSDRVSAATFRWIDLPEGVTGGIGDLSSDGQVYVGQQWYEPGRPFRGTLSGALQFLIPDAADGVSDLYASGISADGKVIVGVVQFEFSAAEVFRWTAGGGFEYLGSPSGSIVASATAVSGGGHRIVVNTFVGGVATGYLWDAASGFAALPGGPGIAVDDISADGTVVALGSGNPGPVIWTEEGGLTPLPSSPETCSYGWSTGVSPNGEYVTGLACGNFARWTRDGELVLIDGGLDHNTDDIRAVSDNGKVIGSARFPLGSTNHSPAEAFLYDDVHGMRSLEEILETDYGLDIGVGLLSSATAISADGRVIVGGGIHNGQFAAWIAVVPEPAGMALAVIGIGAIAIVGRRRIRS